MLISTAGKARNLKLTDLPVEILVLIFEYLFDQYHLGPPFLRITFQPSTSAIRFSLAGSIFYRVLKRLFPIPFTAWFFSLSFQDPIS
jgi:hypothetical protein